MGCEGVDVDPVVTRMSDGGRLMKGEPVKSTYAGPQSNSSAADTCSLNNEHKANTFALAVRW